MRDFSLIFLWILNKIISIFIFPIILEVILTAFIIFLEGFNKNLFYCLISFIIPLSLSLLILLISNRICKCEEKDIYYLIKSKHEYVLISIFLSWFIIPLIYMLPYSFFGLSLIDSYFESVSAWTTTGFSFYSSKDLESLPLPIKIWRHLEQWLGGFGIISMLFIILSKSNFLSLIIKHEGKSEIVFSSFKETMENLFKAYLIITIFGIFFLFLSGMDILNSTMIVLSTIPTGGMAPKELNLNTLQKFLLSILMIVSASNFYMWARIFFENPFLIFRFYGLFEIIVISVVSSLIIFMVDKVNFVDSFFHVVSAMSNTGFSYINLNKLSDFSIFLLILLMMIGGNIGSTTGGIKIDRVIVFIKILLKKTVEHTYGYKIIFPINVNKKLEEETLFFISLYLLTLLVFSLINTLVIENLKISLFETVSSLSNAGLSIGYVSKNIPTLEKIFLIFIMICGRLEILIFFSILILFFRV